MQIITPVNERLNQLDDVLKNGEFSRIHQQNDNQWRTKQSENYISKSEEGAVDTTRSNFLLRAKSWKADRETRPTEKGLQYLITSLAVCAYFGNILFTKYLDIYIYDLYL